MRFRVLEGAARLRVDVAAAALRKQRRHAALRAHAVARVAAEVGGDGQVVAAESSRVAGVREERGKWLVARVPHDQGIDPRHHRAGGVPADEGGRSVCRNCTAANADLYRRPTVSERGGLYAVVRLGRDADELAYQHVDVRLVARPHRVEAANVWPAVRVRAGEHDRAWLYAGALRDARANAIHKVEVQAEQVH